MLAALGFITLLPLVEAFTVNETTRFTEIEGTFITAAKQSSDLPGNQVPKNDDSSEIVEFEGRDGETIAHQHVHVSPFDGSATPLAPTSMSFSASPPPSSSGYPYTTSLHIRLSKFRL